MNTHAKITKVNNSHTSVDKVSPEKSNNIQLHHFQDNRPETAIQNQFQEMAENSSQVNQLKSIQRIANHSISSKNAVSGKNSDGNSKPVVQLAKKNVIVTGLSHLVEMNKKSLYTGENEKEIIHGQTLEIETDGRKRSRRGPNQEIYKEEDKEGEHIYSWYKVVSLDGKPLEGNFYVREDVFVDVKNEKGKSKVIGGFDKANTVVDEITKVPAKLIGNEGITGVADALNDKTVFTNTGGGKGATNSDKTHAANMGITGDSITGITGLLGMANGFVSLGDPEAKTADLIQKAIDIEQGAMKTGEAVSKLVHTASGSKDPTTASKFGSTFEGYGAAFSAIKEAFVGMRKLVNLINEHQDYSNQEKVKAAGEISVHALETAKSIVLSVKAFIELVNGSASGSLMAAVPGLDIAISGGNMIMQGYYLIISNNSRKVMNDRRNELSDDDSEKKEKMKEASTSYRKHDAAIANKKKVIEEYKNKLANPGKKTNKSKIEKEIKRLEIEIAQLELYEHEMPREEVAEFTMVTELRDANTKRVTRQGIHLASEMAKIAGSIATLTGVGAMGGGIIKGAAAATDLALPVARLAKQKARDSKASKIAKGKLNKDDILKEGRFYNVDESKSSTAKYDFRIRQIKYLIKLIVDLAYKDKKKDKKDFKNVENYLKASGVNEKKLFANNGDPQKQIRILLDAFQQREL